MIKRRPITEAHLMDAFNLPLAPGQAQFVSYPARSLAQAYAEREHRACTNVGGLTDELYQVRKLWR